jgi:hypothetical protein
LYPAQASSFATALAQSLALIPNGSPKADGIQLGGLVAQSILTLRANDGAGQFVNYVLNPGLGHWQPTPPANVFPPLLPQWPQVTPWAMANGSQFRNAQGPPGIGSTAYATAYDEVQRLGSLNSVERTADQTEIAYFWADGAGTSTPPGHWNRIAQTCAVAEGNTLSENARLFALLNIAAADAAIVSWDNKYHYDLWRPITGIRAGDLDGNSMTMGDAAWTPLITTPPFPSYTSGHATFSGAAAEILAEFFRSDLFTFTTSAEGFAVPDREFSSFAAAAQEASDSRLFGGIHWRFDNEDGMESGLALGDFVYRTRLQLVPEPTSLLPAILVVGAFCGSRRRRQRARQPSME